jgi:hypothetical protein
MYEKERNLLLVKRNSQVELRNDFFFSPVFTSLLRCSISTHYLPGIMPGSGLRGVNTQDMYWFHELYSHRFRRTHSFVQDVWIWVNKPQLEIVLNRVALKFNKNIK